MKISIALVAAMAFLSVAAQAQDAAAGKTKYATCAACHGAQGQGGAGPKLAGQKPEVIVQKLTTYKNKGQIGAQSQLMWGMAAGLSADDIKNIAAYTATFK
ncbi:c-type cytochrome [Haliscomenobacter sp.]|uniref:c-type cytochrome n=1 Tax=Haliscomenobacter sp. TaxID=2717303 RepID=UPI003364FEE3